MNLVKGVAHLLRRSSSGHHGESTSGLQAERFTLPSQSVCFSEAGNESILNALWEKYENTSDKVEKRRLFHVFLKQFVDVHKKWEPIATGEDADVEHFSQSDLIIGCSVGHPTELVVALTEEIIQLTSFVTDLDIKVVKFASDPPTVSASLRVTSEGLAALEALVIVVRSMHNCRVLGYYGGVQKLVALIKAAVVQLKAISGAIAGDEALSKFAMDTFTLLEKLLVYVVSIVCSFIDLNSNAYEMAHLFSSTAFVLAQDCTLLIDPSNAFKIPPAKLHPWKQTAVLAVMEAGGLNWLVGKSCCVSLED